MDTVVHADGGCNVLKVCNVLCQILTNVFRHNSCVNIVSAVLAINIRNTGMQALFSPQNS